MNKSNQLHITANSVGIIKMIIEKTIKAHPYILCGGGRAIRFEQ